MSPLYETKSDKTPIYLSKFILKYFFVKDCGLDLGSVQLLLIQFALDVNQEPIKMILFTFFTYT